LPKGESVGAAPGDILGGVCARYTLTSSPARVAEHFDLPAAETSALRPRYNVAPGQAVPVVWQEPGRRALANLYWGFQLFAKDGAKAPTPKNARIESTTTHPEFREALWRHRCLVPADGYFEWRRRTAGAEPHWVSLPGAALFGFAGLYGVGLGPKGEAGSLAILTRPGRGPVRGLHGRMPVLVSPRDYTTWLDPELHSLEGALALCESPLSESLTFRPVDPRVNDVRFDDPACLAPSPQLAFL
jgi:putative SOS response-associated peptidase YedK